jgi:hypothetical protein
MPDRDDEYCDAFHHDFEEVYYGWQCTRCGMFYAFGCAPWEEDDDADPR